MCKIKTEHSSPPAPITNHDWCAWYDGEEEQRHYGWGATESEAIENLKANHPREETSASGCVDTRKGGNQ